MGHKIQVELLHTDVERGFIDFRRVRNYPTNRCSNVDFQAWIKAMASLDYCVIYLIATRLHSSIRVDWVPEIRQNYLLELFATFQLALRLAGIDS